MSDLEDDVLHQHGDSEPVSVEPSLPEEPETGISMEEAMEKAIRDVSERARDEQGRFTKDEKAKAEKATPPIEKSQEQPKPEPQPSPEQTAAPETQFKPPVGWSPTSKRDFATLPAHIQADIAKREMEIDAGMKRYTGMNEHMPIIEASGLPLSTFVGNAITWEKNLYADPIGTIRNAAAIAGQRTGMDPRQFLAAALQANGPVAPLQTPLQSPPQPARQAPIDIRAAIEETLKQRELETTVTNFLSDPKYPHAKSVLDEMVSLINTGHASSLQDAYDRAVWMRPDIREGLINTLSQSPAQTPQKQAAADQARKASRSINGSSSPGPAKGIGMHAPKSIEDALNLAWQEHNGVRV